MIYVRRYSAFTKNIDRFIKNKIKPWYQHEKRTTLRFCKLYRLTKRCRLVFTTAWSTVPRILLAITRKYPDVGITYKWFEEGVDPRYGDAVLGGGECLEYHNYT